ncbi:MAG: DUF559 domain-containing protein [Coriobacteriales bacterium]|nr:DUF559 domain-containing protein [Coriobacteriales bacterium]
MIILSHETALQFWRNTALWGWGYREDRMRLTDVPVGELSTHCGKNQARTIASDYELGIPLHVLGSRENRNKLKNKTIHGVPDVMDAIPALVLNEHLAVVAPALCLMQVLNGHDDHEALKLVSEFCGNYALLPHLDGGMRLRDPIVTPQACHDLAERFGGCWGSGKLRRASSHAVVGSASPMETNDALYMTLPYSLGGKHIPGMKLNHPIELDAQAKRLVGSDRLFCDFYWPEQRIAIEYDSDQHHLDSAQHARDARRRSALMAMGIQVFTLTREQNMRMDELDAFLAFVMKQLGYGFRPQSNRYEQRKRELYNALFYKEGL